MLCSPAVDARGGEHLRATLAEMGIDIVTEAESAALQRCASEGDASGERVGQVTLRDGRTLPCDLFITCAGIRSNVELAQAAGLQIKNGVLVDAQMRTNDPHIFAAGDVVEFNDKILGLWAVAVSQAEVAAAGAVSPAGAAEERYTEIVPVTMLKVVGVDLTSIGQIRAQSNDDCEIAQEEAVTHRYRKLVVNNGKVVGAILMGYPEEAPGVAAVAKQKLDIARHLPALQAGDWSCFQDQI
ncbi:MAG: FAD-dependent oxidoreductase [Caldilineaceae bacterium]